MGNGRTHVTEKLKLRRAIADAGRGRRSGKPRLDEADVASAVHERRAAAKGEIAKIGTQFSSQNYVDHWNAMDALLAYDDPDAFALILSRFSDNMDLINAEDSAFVWFIARPRTALAEIAKALTDGRREPAMHFLFYARKSRLTAFGPAPQAAFEELDRWLDVTPVGDEGMVREVLRRRQTYEAIERMRKAVAGSTIAGRDVANTFLYNMERLGESLTNVYGDDLEAINGIILYEESHVLEAIAQLEALDRRRIQMLAVDEEAAFIENTLMRPWETVLIAAGGGGLYAAYNTAKATSLDEAKLYQTFKIDQLEKAWGEVSKEPTEILNIHVGGAGLYEAAMEIYAAFGYYRHELSGRITDVFLRHHADEALSLPELAEIQRDLTIVGLFLVAFSQMMVLGGIYKQLEDMDWKVVGDFSDLRARVLDYAYQFHTAAKANDVEAIGKLASDTTYQNFLEYDIEDEVQDRVDDTRIVALIITIIAALVTLGTSLLAEGFLAGVVGLSGAALSFSVFAVEVTVFTLVHAGLRSFAFGEPITFESIGIDLFWNAITFGAFKFLGGGISKIAIGQEALGKVLTFATRHGLALGSFIGVAAVIERLRTGKWPSSVRQLIEDSVIMYVVLAAAAKGLQPLRKKLHALIANKKLAAQVEADLARLDALTLQLDGRYAQLAGAPNTATGQPEPLKGTELEQLRSELREHALLTETIAKTLKEHGVLAPDAADAIIKSAREIFGKLGDLKIGDIPVALLDLASVPDVKPIGTDGTTYSYQPTRAEPLSRALLEFERLGYKTEWDPTAQQVLLFDPQGRLAARLIPDLRSPATSRVEAPIQGAYDAIDLTKRPAEFDTLSESVKVLEHDAGGNPTRVKVTIRAYAKHGGKTVEAVVERIFDFTTGELVQKMALFDTGFPEWVAMDPRFDPNRGVPTSVYLLLRALKLMKVPFGGVKTVKLDTVINVRTMVELEIGLRQGKTLDTAILETHSVAGYTQSFLMQSGHKVTGARVTDGFRFTFEEAFAEMESKYPAQVKIARNKLAAAGIPETDSALIGFNVYLDVAPVSATTVPSPITAQPPAPPPPTPPAKTTIPPFVPIPRQPDTDIKKGP